MMILFFVPTNEKSSSAVWGSSGRGYGSESVFELDRRKTSQSRLHVMKPSQLQNPQLVGSGTFSLFFYREG